MEEPIIVAYSQSMQIQPRRALSLGDSARRFIRSRLPVIALAVLVLFARGALASEPAIGPLSVSKENPRYFSTPGGRVVYLAGAHDGWELQDFAWGDKAPERPFDWPRFLDFLTAHHHNVIRLWCVEHTKISDADTDLTEPMPWLRVAGRGHANDGRDKFDLDRFNLAYFHRLRERVTQARERGVYVIVMLFQGWSIDDKGGKVNPWPNHPFHPSNNVNGLNGDRDADGQGSELHTWLGQNHPITRRQRDYVRRVVEAVNDLDNVLYEIANESHTGSLDWQNRMVDFIRATERTLGKSHPVGITVPFGGERQAELNEELFESKADWISPNRESGGFNYRDNPPPADGRKVVLSDSDHLQGNSLQDHRWVWKTFCRGHNVLFMDRWTEEPHSPLRGQVRRAIGQTVDFARRMDLARTVPQAESASTGYCLVNPGRACLVYQPNGGAFTVDLPETQNELAVEWLEPRSGNTRPGEPVRGGGTQTFQPPFGGDAVLWLGVQAKAP